MELKKLSIVIPAYNEARTIHRIHLDKVGSIQLLAGWEKQVIVVSSTPRWYRKCVEKLYRKSSGQWHNIVWSTDTTRARAAQNRNPTKQAVMWSWSRMPIWNILMNLTCSQAQWRETQQMWSMAPVLWVVSHIVSYFLALDWKQNIDLCVNTNLNLTDMKHVIKMWKAEVIKTIQLKENRFWVWAQ